MVTVTLPTDYTSRCTDTHCSWRTSTTDPDYRDTLSQQHTARYGHTTTEQDYQ